MFEHEINALASPNTFLMYMQKIDLCCHSWKATWHFCCHGTVKIHDCFTARPKSFGTASDLVCRETHCEMAFQGAVTLLTTIGLACKTVLFYLFIIYPAVYKLAFLSKLGLKTAFLPWPDLCQRRWICWHVLFTSNTKLSSKFAYFSIFFWMQEPQ